MSLGSDPGKSRLVIDSSLIWRTIRYYVVIAVGLGLLGVVLLRQLGGGESTSGQLISGLLSLVILSFAVLSGPVIAAFVGYATARGSSGGIRQRCISSGVANGIGFAIFGIIILIILSFGLASVAGGGSDGGAGSAGSPSIKTGGMITLIINMMFLNGFVGGAITFFIERQKSETSESGSVRSTSRNQDNRRLLDHDNDIEMVHGQTFTHYDFDIKPYWQDGAELTFSVKTATSETVDVFLTTREDREDADSIEDLSPINQLSREDVGEAVINGVLKPGEWSIVVWNPRPVSIKINFAYKIEADSREADS